MSDQRIAGRDRLRAALTVLLAAVLCPTAYALPAQGEVRFIQLAQSSFDPYLEQPTASEQAWMRDHYDRILGWSPFFDERLDWYPDGWAYKDAYAIKPGTEVFAQHPEWVLRDAGGTMLYIPFDCSGGTCPQYAGDFGNPAFRNWWIGQAQALAQTGYRGIWIDDVNMTWRASDGYENPVTPWDVRTGAPMTLDNWRRYMAEFMEQVRAAVPQMELAHNIIWYAGPRENDDVNIARQIDAADYLNLERGVTDRGLTGTDGRYGLETFLQFVDYLHGRGRSVIFMDEGGSVQDREYALAGWFAISNGVDLMSSEEQQWTAPDSWWHGYDSDLGVALGDRYRWNDLIRRDFDCGMVLMNKPDWPTATVTLPEPMTNLAGQTVASVALGESTAAVLTRACQSGTQDADTDGVPDAVDNCAQAANADQRDSDADGYGNRCDGDFNGDCKTNFADLAYMRSAFATADSHADLDGSGEVDFGDLARLKSIYGTAPGPAADGHCP